MSDQVFIRMRGRIQGPFSSEQLQLMARKGQFSRMHEVSTDGITWSRASSSPELFPTRSEVALKPIEAAPAVAVPPAIGPSIGPPTQNNWYYHQFGNTNGPVDFARLQSMVDAGQLVGEEMVWKEGMPEWVHAARVPGLVRRDESVDHRSTRSDAAARHFHSDSSIAPPRVSGLAVASLVLGILWLFGLGSLLAIIFGGVAIHQIRISRGQTTGMGLAVAGLTLGIVFGVIQLIMMILPPLMLLL